MRPWHVCYWPRLLRRKDVLGRVPEVDLSQRVQTYLFDRNVLI
jgi:hypothetical protein